MKRKMKNLVAEWWKNFMKIAEMEARMRSNYWM
jgi:hypothetical protein